MRPLRRIRNIRAHADALAADLPETEEVTDALVAIVDQVAILRRVAEELPDQDEEE